jgi:quercetin dioxygenase-like cupin family protein
MLNRACFLVGVCFINAPGAIAQDQPAIAVKEILSTVKNDAGQTLRLPSRNLQLVVSEYNIAAGARLPEHKHPYQRYAYVAQGELLVQQIGRASKIYRAGDFVVESVNRWHFGEAIGQTPVKLIVIDQLPKGAKSTITH